MDQRLKIDRGKHNLKTPQDIGTGNDFLNRTQEIITRTDKWDYIKLNSFRTSKNWSPEGRQLTEWKEIFASYSSDKGLISRIYKELKKLKPKRISNPIKMGK
jgi:hypothetical protein